MKIALARNLSAASWTSAMDAMVLRDGSLTGRNWMLTRSCDEEVRRWREGLGLMARVRVMGEGEGEG